ncbi:hypothetical protein ACFL1H_05655 [Nanoarchaeota archaeon]
MENEKGWYPSSEWKTIERPGWFGTKRNDLHKGYNEKYGEDNWRIAHQLGPYVLPFEKSVLLYELCYERDFLHPDRRYIWNDLIKNAKDVWTESKSDIECGLDYFNQQVAANHYEDIAIRRILNKYGQEFQGDKLIRIRADADDLIGKALSSIHIPFIYPDYIEAPFDDSSFHWWDRHKGSLECFWHFNKVLQVRN